MWTTDLALYDWHAGGDFEASAQPCWPELVCTLAAAVQNYTKTACATAAEASDWASTTAQLLRVSIEAEDVLSVQIAHESILLHV